MFSVLHLLIAFLFGATYALPSDYDTEHVWVPGNLSYPLPSNALVGGLNPSGYKLYVGRVKYRDSVVPASVFAESGIAGGNTEYLEFVVRTYELLTTQENKDYKWIRSYDGHLENYAVSTGTSDLNERAFVCRHKGWDGVITIGTLFLTKKTCLVLLDYEYIYSYDKYEVLVAVPKTKGAQHRI